MSGEGTTFSPLGIGPEIFLGVSKGGAPLTAQHQGAPVWAPVTRPHECVAPGEGAAQQQLLPARCSQRAGMRAAAQTQQTRLTPQRALDALQTVLQGRKGCHFQWRTLRISCPMCDPDPKKEDLVRIRYPTRPSLQAENYMVELSH